MLNIWNCEALPPEILQLLQEKELEAVIHFAGGSSVRLLSLQTFDGHSLICPVPFERSPLGRGLVEALWFDRPAVLSLRTRERCVHVSVRVYRCHIAGPLFAGALLAVRSGGEAEDMASAWELYWQGSAEAPADLQPRHSWKECSHTEKHLDLL